MNLVLSFGDLAEPGGYRTRVLGELHALDRLSSNEPFLLVFDRNPDKFRASFQSDIPHQVLHRSAVLRFSAELRRLIRSKPIQLVHAHNLYSAALALSLRWRYGYKVVLDYHGRIPEEYVFLGKGGSASRTGLELLERWCVRSADHVVAVSHKLAEYLAGRYQRVENISVIPCCADDKKFYWDPQRRDEARAALGLSGKFVCTHLGSFVDWYDPAMIVDAFSRIRACAGAHLLVITGDAGKARTYLSAHFPENTFTVRRAAHDEVPALLNASDVGLLLLRPSPNIKTSSPAKFSEYLNSGLPVLITPDVGDYSEMVAREDVGAVFRARDTSLVEAFTRQCQGHRAQVAARCVEAGRQLTWSTFSSTWKDIVRVL